MKRIAFPIAVLLSSALLLSCGDSLRKYHQDFYVFGTLMGITIRASDDGQAQEAFAALQARFQQMHSEWHAWEPGLLTSINEAFREGRAAEANDEIVEMVRQSQRIEEASNGYFNPAIGQLIALWGFHTSEYPIIGPPPPASEIDALAALAPSSLDVHIDGRSLSSDNPAVQLEITGHADERGSDEYNMALGMRRANAAKQWLVDHGIDESRITVRSMGEENPMAMGSNEDAWAQNRRDEFAITAGGDRLVMPTGM